MLFSVIPVRHCHSRVRGNPVLFLRREEPAGFCHLQWEQKAEPFRFHPTQTKIGFRLRGSDICVGAVRIDGFFNKTLNAPLLPNALNSSIFPSLLATKEGR